MTVYEALSLMILFATLVVLILKTLIGSFVLIV
ncbi:MAG: putative holin-like toxin [Veillonella sp.]|nr:putative holin-like toxin [Veillonella sp.]